MRPIEPKRRLRHAVARARSIRLLALLFLLWPTALAAPGRFQVEAVVSDAQGAEMTRVAPRMVSVNSEPGY